ncbi:MAG TPA: hypothetical protein PK885_04360, partial [Candidatus Marinimicrobia bacterium]|nr:hypothetical protein [Candidatus Neomarinimicrobiota bacterium]
FFIEKFYLKYALKSITDLVNERNLPQRHEDTKTLMQKSEGFEWSSLSSPRNSFSISIDLQYLNRYAVSIITTE